MTSREPLHIEGEALWRVPPLTVPDPGHEDPLEAGSVQLFVDRARAHAHDFTVTPERLEAIATICRRLDGIPLGIELAAARVRLLSVAQIAERLRDRFTMLTYGDRNAPVRQRTLRAVLDWSYDMLDEPERRLLRRLSVFSDWDLDLAERVCADESLPAHCLLDLMVSLVDRSLVTVVGEVQGRMRYRMLDTIRQYALARLAESGEETRLRLRHREQVLALAEELAHYAVAGYGVSWEQRFSAFQRVCAGATMCGPRSPGRRSAGTLLKGCGCVWRCARIGWSTVCSRRGPIGPTVSWPWTAPMRRCAGRRWCAGLNWRGTALTRLTRSRSARKGSGSASRRGTTGRWRWG